jgi:L-seryl-tRNA(Ser) seleniumtransferase
MNSLRNLPSVDQLLSAPTIEALIQGNGRPLTLSAVRLVLDEIRQSYHEKEWNENSPALPDVEQIALSVKRLLEGWTAPTLTPVINASGVVLHTNLGRAPLSRAAQEAVAAAGRDYLNLEYDLGRGKRGSRLLHADELLQRLTGAEAAVVVNNNASAVLLTLMTLARRRRVVISRSQLVEIGGGFRIPEVMKQSGAKLVEVGTTNRVHVRDFEQALQEPAALIMRAHSSNFRLIGFTAEPELSEIATLAHQYGVLMVDDLGSGALLDTAAFGLQHEPMVQESLAAGSDLVCFSGDKLVGGPQAGIIVGKADLVAKIKKHPLARAVRADKLCLAGLAATLTHYLKDEALSEVPIWRMISMKSETIRERALRWCGEISNVCDPAKVTLSVIEGRSTVGGGSLPEEMLPTYLLAMTIRKPDRMLARLREGPMPVIARIEHEKVVFDPRTVNPAQESNLIEALHAALQQVTK